MAKTAKQYLDTENQLETEKNYWKNQWQLVSEYVHQRRADFTATKTPGAFISSNLWTDDPSHMAETSASAFLGYIWSAAEKSFKLAGNDKLFGKDREMREFWNDATETLQEEMGDQDAGLATALDEIMLDIIVLGTSAMFTEERNEDQPLQGCLAFGGWSILEFSLKENAAGRAAIFYRRKEYTVEQAVEKYGYDNLSKKVREAFDKKNFALKVVILHAIEPRVTKKPAVPKKTKSKAAKDMPIASVHIEVDTKHIVRDSGYPELPVACARLAKRLKESYGRGRGMNALPSIMLLNQIWEDLMLAQEKKLDPPMYVLNDSVAGGGVLDTSAGSLTVLRVDKTMPNVPPVGKLYDMQDTSDVAELIEKIQNTISNHFMIDRLLNMDNETEMTAREALLRNAIRQSTLRSIVSRLLMELFEPMINTSFMICLRRGKFGYMPDDPKALAMERMGQEVKYLPQKFIDAMKSGSDLYSIEYLTPAARDLMAEEAQGMIQTVELLGSLAKFDDTIPAILDAHWTANRFAEIGGASNKMFKSEKAAKKAIDDMNAMKQKAMEAQIAQANAGVAKDEATAQNMVAPQ